MGWGEPQGPAEPFGIEGALEALAVGAEAHPEADVAALQAELDGARAEIARLRAVESAACDLLHAIRPPYLHARLVPPARALEIALDGGS